MPLTLSNLAPKKGSRKRRKRVGRGDSSGHGTYSGRGQKGQRSRSGGKKKLALKGLRATLWRISKKGGFKSIKPKMACVNLGDLEKKFKKNEIIDPEKLVKVGLIRTKKFGVKVLAKPFTFKRKVKGKGRLTKAFTVKAQAFSDSAKSAIKKAGGKVISLKNRV